MREARRSQIFMRGLVTRVSLRNTLKGLTTASRSYSLICQTHKRAKVTPAYGGKFRYFSRSRAEQSSSVAAYNIASAGVRRSGIVVENRK